MSVSRLCKNIILLLLAAFIFYHLWIIGHIWWWRTHNPTSTAFMRAQLRELRVDNPQAQISYQWVPYRQISRHLKRAVIAAEDAKFIEHDGFDWDGIQHAWEKNLKKGKIVAGGSTISQQLAKNLFLSSSRNPLRKAEEALITILLENMMDKERILEIYLNVIQWGNSTFGAEMAARRYYKTSAASLTAGQAARLAAMIPNPEYYETHPQSRRLHYVTGIIGRRIGSADIP